MTTANRLISLLGLLSIFISSVFAADPCVGKGTKMFFVNGLFNNATDAKNNLAALEAMTVPSVGNIRNLEYKLAWVEGENYYLQLAMAMIQRGVDDFQKYWLWISGLEKAPDWFERIIKDTVFNPKLLNAAALPRIEKHMELYSDAILNGYDVIIVSHSVGSFYANAALRGLSEYSSRALQPCIAERNRRNSLYPKADEMIGRIQIASPAGILSRSFSQQPQFSTETR